MKQRSFVRLAFPFSAVAIPQVASSGQVYSARKLYWVSRIKSSLIWSLKETGRCIFRRRHRKSKVGRSNLVSRFLRPRIYSVSACYNIFYRAPCLPFQLIIVSSHFCLPLPQTQLNLFENRNVIGFAELIFLNLMLEIFIALPPLRSQFLKKESCFLLLKW